MSLREFLAGLDRDGDLVRVAAPVSTVYEAAALMKKLDPRPILFHNVKEAPGFKLVGNLCADRGIISRALGVPEERLLERLAQAIENPGRIEVVGNPPCQEVVIEDPDLRRLPFLRFAEKEGGPYLTAGIVIAYDAEYGYNASYHRLMLLDSRRVVARILPRHLDEYIKRGARRVAITIGNHPAFMLAAAVTWKIGTSELGIASALAPIKYAKTISGDLLVPADCEVVLEGVVTDELADEGPFVDITGTYDIVRKQRVIEIERVTMRRDPIFQQILPAGSEHRILMGMPREAAIYRRVSEICEVLDVKLTPGGCGWLHCAIKIRKKSDDEPRMAIEAAFEAHPSLKHVVVVDEDIDISDPYEVEWAIATRTQLDRDLVLKPNQLGSSLDPSADQITRRTCKAGVDATIPLGADREKFVKVKIPGEEEVNVNRYAKR
ncbi:MAG: UbiD family decarboxylase [Nitrososphaerota archaeon]|nr:UbiD family decarboxylase [Nitrososphaerota archaeon]